MTGEAMKKFIFGENFLTEEDLITLKLQKHEDEIRKIFLKLNPENPNELLFGAFKDFWL